MLGIDGHFVGSTKVPNRKPQPAKQPASKASAPARQSAPSRASAPATRYAPPVSAPSQPTGSGAVQRVTKPAPKPPSIREYLAGDDVYQQAQRGSKRTLNDFLSELARQRSVAGTDFRTAQGTMEQDRERALAQLHDEFASRGTLHSGMYGTEVGRYEQDFTQQMSEMQRAHQEMLAGLLTQQQNFKREQQLAQERARQEALARRAATHNIR